MATKKQQYYRLSKILKNDAHYYMLLGERSNGKSYAVKEKCVTDAYKDDNKKFILLRRWGVDIKRDLIESYFQDCPVSTITNGEYTVIVYYMRKLYLANIDENGTIEKGKVMGYCRDLTGEEHYKSGSYLDVTNVIYEEFVSRSGYINREVQKLQSFISTVARKRKINVFLIGNTISRVCPYFTEWELINVKKMKQGQIDLYEKNTGQKDEETGENVIVKIAVELCESSGTNSAMFFGNSSNMTIGGAWESEEHAHLTYPIEMYNTRFSFVLEYDSNRFLCRFLQHKTKKHYIWYIEEKTTEIQKNTRIVSNHVYENDLATTWFYSKNDYEKTVFNLLLQDKVAFCNNLTGSEFKQCLKDME